MADDLDIRVLADFPDHRKTRRMVAIAGEGSVRCLLRVWIYAARRYPKGVLEGLNVEDIELEARWEGERGVFVAALLQTGWIDFDGVNYSLHDWADHQGWMYFKPERSQAAKILAERRWEKERDKRVAETAAFCGAQKDPLDPKDPQDPQLFVGPDGPAESRPVRPVGPVGPVRPVRPVRPVGPVGPEIQRLTKTCADAARNAPVPVPDPLPDPGPRPGPVPIGVITAGLQKQLQQTTGTTGTDREEWRCMRKILYRLKWNSIEVKALVDWCVARWPDPNPYDPTFIFPIANAIEATRNKKDNRVVYVWSCEKSPNQCDIDEAKAAIASERDRMVDEAKIISHSTPSTTS